MTLGQAVAGFAAVAALITVLPGLDTALVLRSTLTTGRRAAVWIALGACVGVLVWGVAAAVGLAALLTASRVGYEVVRYLGAAYLVYLGLRLLISSLRRSSPELAAPLGRTPSRRRAMTTGILTNLLNPKVGVFYLATIPQFLVPGIAPLLVGALLASIHALITAAWFSLIIGAAGTAARQLRRPRVTRTIDAITGGVLVAFGVRTALQH